MYKRSLANACAQSVAIRVHVHASAFSNTSMRTAPSNACVQRLSTANWSPSSCHATALSDTRVIGMLMPIRCMAVYLLHIPSLHNRVRETLSMIQRMLPEGLRGQARCGALGKGAIDSCVEKSILCAKAPARRKKTSRPAWRKPGSSQLPGGRRGCRQLTRACQ